MQLKQKKMCVHFLVIIFNYNTKLSWSKNIGLYYPRKNEKFSSRGQALVVEEQHKDVERPLLLLNNLSTNYNNYIRRRSMNYDDGH